MRGNLLCLFFFFFLYSYIDLIYIGVWGGDYLRRVSTHVWQCCFRCCLVLFGVERRWPCLLVFAVLASVTYYELISE